MFRSIRKGTKGAKPATPPSSATAFVQPKSTTKCLYPVERDNNQCHGSSAAPKGETARTLRDSRPVCPRGAREHLDVQAGPIQHILECTASPALETHLCCQGSLTPVEEHHPPIRLEVLCKGIVSLALEGMPVASHVNLTTAAALQRASSLFSPKSQMMPAAAITFLGKWPDSFTQAVMNTKGMLLATMGLWLWALGSGLARLREMARLLKRLPWVGRAMARTALILIPDVNAPCGITCGHGLLHMSPGQVNRHGAHDGLPQALTHAYQQCK